MRNLLSTFTVTVAMLMVVMSPAHAEEPYKAGVHYEVLTEAVVTSNPAKIEVAEVFWYGCSHCYSFEPVLNKWTQALPEDVDFVRVPAIWHPIMRLHAKAYFTAKALKSLDQIHEPIFEAMNLKKAKLKTEEEIAALFEAQGIDRARFTKVFNSAGINMAVDLAEKKQERYRTQGTPEMVVNGKYRISGRDNGGNEGMLKVVSYLIEQERLSIGQ
ncbi:thiol:disulfide interchange protein DsbA/DsbL [Porticoccus sp.]|uniref:thiol:disulfide interchange protein DsbA/DsbL n=1 Tax=Porticoccus sp. TaxID=2024853 RepID=UPI003F69E874